MKKATAVAPSNVAFIKYWGRKNEKLRLPVNGSISMNLSGLTTKTTVEFASRLQEDTVTLDDVKLQGNTLERVREHLNRVRKLAGISEKAKVVSKNNFPRGTGLSSSASGFAALTLAATKAAGLELSKKELSILARLGSGSACRSIPDGFVEWIDGDTSEESYAYSIFPEDYWDIVDIVCIFSTAFKEVFTSDGQKRANTSPFFAIRQEKINDKIEKIKKAISKRDFQTFGAITEAEALEMHAIMITSNPPLIYWYPETITLIRKVKQWRMTGIPVYWTLNTGHNIHIICHSKNADLLSVLIRKLPGIQQVIRNIPSIGARIVEDHLF